MGCNENVVRNVTAEVVRGWAARGGGGGGVRGAAAGEEESALARRLLELMLLQPRHARLLAGNLHRGRLEALVNECVDILVRGDPGVHTLRLQQVMSAPHDAAALAARHRADLEACLAPLRAELTHQHPPPGGDQGKLFRKISIYLILASGLGNPASIQTLKEGMAALESVVPQSELGALTSLPRHERAAQLDELLAVVAGVRLFNRDCGKGGDNINNLPAELQEACAAAAAALAGALLALMQRINQLTSAAERAIALDERGAVSVAPPEELTVEDYSYVFSLLWFTRQHEVYTRRLLQQLERCSRNSAQLLERYSAVLLETHAAVKYKAAVPVDTVFPLFTRLWAVWRAMQGEAVVVGGLHRLWAALAATHDLIKPPQNLLDKMLVGKKVVSDQERMSSLLSMQDRMSLGSLKNYALWDEAAPRQTSTAKGATRQVEYLGFCAMCLCVGALIPSNIKIGIIKHGNARYSFCNVKMAAVFSKDPQRYINEVLHYVRNHPALINLLNLYDEVEKVKHIENLVVPYEVKTKTCEQDVQTELHPVETHIDTDYSWNLWEHKRRACTWATIVRCSTHSTQTIHSHMRSEIHCQTTQPRHKALQTRRDVGVLADKPLKYLCLKGEWDLSPWIDFTPPIDAGMKLKVLPMAACGDPCLPPPRAPAPAACPSDLSQLLEEDIGTEQEGMSEQCHTSLT